MITTLPWACTLATVFWCFSLVLATPQSAAISVNLGRTAPLAPDLFGVFFEEVSSGGCYSLGGFLKIDVQPGPSFHACSQIGIMQHMTNISQPEHSVQINNAGEGGLHAEMVQDRSFDAFAYASKFEEPMIELKLNKTVLQQANAKILTADAARSNHSSASSWKRQTLSRSSAM